MIMRCLSVLISLIVVGCAVKNSNIKVIPASRISPVFEKKETKGTYHNVEKGETLYKISRAYDIEIAKIIEVNRITNPSLIKEGQLLYIPETDFKSKYRETNFIWPIKGEVVSSYGDNTFKGANRGIDIRSRGDLTVKAAGSGSICYTGEDVKGYGKMIIIDHGKDIYTLYAYNETLLVNKGNFVTQGDSIAVLAKENPLLHFEIRQKHKTLNPLNFL
ncbi:MAG: peptidoglycan DD-metalloendopeptidase family protein [Candidatus Saelkia tenebricola]|nr:peptidoglycan DD-metalloendopeptidase family protein [Candidatus Saelkia tenebricola]